MLAVKELHFQYSLWFSWRVWGFLWWTYVVRCWNASSPNNNKEKALSSANTLMPWQYILFHLEQFLKIMHSFAGNLFPGCHNFRFNQFNSYSGLRREWTITYNELIKSFWDCSESCEIQWQVVTLLWEFPVTVDNKGSLLIILVWWSLKAPARLGLYFSNLSRKKQ